MLRFDTQTYLREVLQPLKGETPDEFARYCLEVTDDDDAAIKKRLAEVGGYWKNNSTAAGEVGRVIKSMLREHNTLVGQLEDAQSRHQLRDRLKTAQAQAAAANWAQVDSALEQIQALHGGIPDESRVRLIELGKQLDLSQAEVESHITDAIRAKGWKVVAPAQIIGEPLPEAKARQIHQVVRRFADTQAHETGNRSPVRSLFEALGLQMDADVHACTAQIASLEDKLNSQVRSSSDYGAAGRQLAQLAKANLGTDDGITQYRATLVQAVKAELAREFGFLSVDDAIDAEENAKLLHLAAAAGLSPDIYAREAVNLLFKESAEAGRPVTRVEGERVEIILCAACGQPDSIGSGHAQCLQCGQPLYRECAQCHRDVPRGEAVCRYCNHSMQAAIQLDAALRDGRQALAAGRPDQAAHNAAAALAIDPNSVEADLLRADSQVAIQRAIAAWRTVREALNRRCLYAAKAALQALVEEGSDVQDGGQYPGEVQKQIADDLVLVDERLVAARNETDDVRRERLFAEVLGQATDCEAAQRALSHIPPQPPRRLEAEIVGQSVHLRWEPSPSPGISGYVIVRGRQRTPADVDQGDRISSTQATAATDLNVGGGLTVAYAVFAQRAGTTSAPAGTGPLLTAFEASDVQATVGSGEVRLSWQLASPGATVEVERSSSDGSVTLEAGGDGLVDTSVINGRVYNYRVRTRYGTQITAGVEVAATPAEPPRAVVLHGLDAVADGVRISWTPPETGAVSVVRSSKAMELVPGSEIRRNDLSSLGTLLPGGGGSATDPSPVDGAWYTPVTILGDRAVLGAPIRWTDIPAITDVQIKDAGEDVAVSWNWPSGVRHAVVLWREGGAPEGLDDPKARRATVARAVQQEVSGGVFRLSREQPREPLRVAVHGAQMRDGELVVGSRLAQTSRASIDSNQARETISYDIRVKGGLRGKSLEFMLSGAASFPEVVLVSRPGDVMPLNPDAGQPVARLGGNGGPATVALPLGALPKDRPLTLRAFLATDGAKASYALRDPADLTKLTLR